MIIYYSGVGTPKGTEAEDLLRGGCVMLSFQICQIMIEQTRRLDRIVEERESDNLLFRERPSSF